MLFWSIQIIVLSFLFIFLIHHLFNFFKNTLTTPKVKDLVNIHTEKYNAIYDVIYNPLNANVNANEKKETQNSHKSSTIDIRSLLPIPESSDMKNELKSFLKKQMHVSNNSNNSNNSNINNDFHSSSTSIDFLDSKIGFTSLS